MSSVNTFTESGGDLGSLQRCSFVQSTDFKASSHGTRVSNWIPAMHSIQERETRHGNLDDAQCPGFLSDVNGSENIEEEIPEDVEEHVSYSILPVIFG